MSEELEMMEGSQEREKLSSVGANKIKLLKLYEYLCRESCDDISFCRCRTKDLLKFLQSQGIKCDRRTLNTDIETLRAYGYHVETVHSGQNIYIIPDDDRDFTIAELHVLLDAVQAASFISPKLTNRLFQRLSARLSKRSELSLSHRRVAFNTLKTMRDDIVHIIDVIGLALEHNHKLTFKCIDLDEKLQPVYRHNGAVYVVEPIGLVYRDDMYYLVAWVGEQNRVKYYRVDRLVEVCEGGLHTRMSAETVLESDKSGADEPLRTLVNDGDKVSKRCLEYRTKLNDVVEKSVHMFKGSERVITLCYKQGEYDALRAIYNRFGTSVHSKIKQGRGEYSGWMLVSVRAQISPTLWGWLAGFRGQIRLYDAKSQSEYENFLRMNLENAQIGVADKE